MTQPPFDHSIVFASSVAPIHRGSLEMLVYFNSCQSRVADGIIDAVERFGPPEILTDGDLLRVRVQGMIEAQSLFAVEASTGRPLGVAVYARSDFQHMLVVHLGIAAEFASGGKRAHEQLLLRLLRELRRCSRQIKGVQRCELLYVAGRSRHAERLRAMPARAFG
ncbi:MAG TPA: hypothetical protein VK629_19445 [Steroidobacteraceae bacterium]|nr:hypothetical protein [Steroidobacteraceae bacterium]